MMPASPPMAPDEPLTREILVTASLAVPERVLAFEELSRMFELVHIHSDLPHLHWWRKQPVQFDPNANITIGVSYKTLLGVVRDPMFATHYGMMAATFQATSSPLSAQERFMHLHHLTSCLVIMFDGTRLI